MYEVANISNMNTKFVKTYSVGTIVLTSWIYQEYGLELYLPKGILGTI